MTKRVKSKNIISFLLIVVLVISLLPFTVYAGTESPGSRGSAAAKSTSAENGKNAVTVYVSVSNDGEFVTGNDANETVMARVPVTVEYFDLADYGLDAFYRYETDENGDYIGSEVIEQPTLLHCYIRILEQYYLGGEKLEIGGDALSISGSATSLYMTKFWGHDENLMYFVDHAYPLMREGWGATSDWILLEDGMEVDLAMFSDWSFYMYGAFAYFNTSEAELEPNEDLQLTMLGTGTMDYSSVAAPMEGETIKISKDLGKTWEETDYVTDESGKVTLRFEDSGTYYISAGPQYETYKADNGAACVAPPVCTVTVKVKEASVPVTGIQCSHKALSLQKGQTQQLTASVIPSNADNNKIVWSSSNSSVASVNSNGIVAAHEKGTAVITAMTEDGNFTANCTVTVLEEEPAAEPETPILQMPQAPGRVKASSAGYKSVRISWNRVSKADGYQIYRASSKTGSYKRIKNTTTASFKNTGLTTGQKYYYKVRAYTKSGNNTLYSGFSNTASAKPALAAPQRVKAKAGKKRAAIRWKKVSGASGYKVYRSAKKNGKYKAVKTIKKQRTVAFTNKKLKKGKTYYYKVRAYRTVKGKKVYSPYSKAVKAKIR